MAGDHQVLAQAERRLAEASCVRRRLTSSLAHASALGVDVSMYVSALRNADLQVASSMSLRDTLVALLGLRTRRG